MVFVSCNRQGRKFIGRHDIAIIHNLHPYILRYISHTLQGIEQHLLI
ncbi:hypothetical protein HMPREF0880_02989 [Yokenella regensburgei ATCC 43003]|nr:hypothetical protein HMPREF0880_02989 [Yokenella regensburgei ATCC 43003]